ncbi:MAG: hypothetical protein AAFW89_07715 [Bacteroidota bacterium]
MIEICAVKGVRNFTLVVYGKSDRTFCFDVIDSAGKFYVCPERFATAKSAEARAISLIGRAIVEIEQQKFEE